MHVVEPSVKLINDIDESAISTLYLAAKRCTSELDGSELLDSVILSPGSLYEYKKLIKKCYEAGHESILEHVSVTFHVTCSRACSLQLVRHRLASYAQQSQRYVKYEDIDYINKFFNSKNAVYLSNTVRQAEDYYKCLIELGIEPEEARYVLPECTATHLVVTINLRELIHFLQLRLCNKAQDEIRFIANEMKRLVCEETDLDFLFKDINPVCFKQNKCTQLKPCKEQPWRNKDGN